jgi:hypothetical protein
MGITGYRVTYKSRRSDTFTSTYYFMVSDHGSSDAAWSRAYGFMEAIKAERGAASVSPVIATNQPTNV